MKKKIHFALFGTTGPEQWLADSSSIYHWSKPDLLQDIAKLAERAKLDLIFFADQLAMPTQYKNSLEFAANTGQGVMVEPLITLAMLSAVTKRIGLGATVSTTFTPPYLVARQFNSLDHVSGGRAAWNVVTSTDPELSKQFGIDLPPHDLRYDMADEHLAACRGLWDSWEDGAVIEDKERRVFADYSKIKTVDFEGKYYKVKGPLNMVPSPQRQPVIIMAGTSPRGQRFAVENADMVIAHKNSLADMKRYSGELRQKLVEAGRDPKSCKIFYAIRPWIGATEEEAREKMERNAAQARVQDGLGYLSMTLGMDLSSFDLDAPLSADMKVDAMMGKLLQFTQSLKGTTLREAALMDARRETIPIYGTRDQVCDMIESLADEGDADGFHFRYATQDYAYLVELTTTVIPELQRRGRFRKEYSGTTLRHHLFGEN